MELLVILTKGSRGSSDGWGMRMIPVSEVLNSDLEGPLWTIVECFSSGTVSTTSELLDILPFTSIRTHKSRRE